MIYEFHVLYRLNALAPELKSVAVRAECAASARALVETAGVVAHGVGPGLPVLDPQQQTFNSQEACAYLHCELSTLNNYMNFDWLPKFKGGKPVFTRAQLDAVIKRGAEEKLPWSRKKAA